MVNKPRIQGTGEERRQKELLKLVGHDVVRLAEEGINDMGDLLLTVKDWELYIESKNRSNLNLHETLQKAIKKSDTYRTVVFWKRLSRKGDNERRSQVGQPIVAMSEELFIELLEYVRLVQDPFYIRNE